MENSRKYEGLKFSEESVTKVSDSLTIEQALEIVINEKPFTVVMQTPGDEEALAIGLLYAENVIDVGCPYTCIKTTDENGQINRVVLTIDPLNLRDGYLSARSLLSVSSCGICGKQSLDDLPNFDQPTIKSNSSWQVSKLMAMQEKMHSAQKLFIETGGCHGVAAFNEEGDLLAIKEDIGRHNAMDKVVGELIMKKDLASAKIIHFSGRISYEIVAKAFRAKIRLIIAVSAPSSLAVDFAKELGITILAFSRAGKTTCYSHPERIVFQ